MVDVRADLNGSLKTIDPHGGTRDTIAKSRLRADTIETWMDKMSGVDLRNDWRVEGLVANELIQGNTKPEMFGLPLLEVLAGDVSALERNLGYPINFRIALSDVSLRSHPKATPTKLRPVHVCFLVDLPSTSQNGGSTFIVPRVQSQDKFLMRSPNFTDEQKAFKVWMDIEALFRATDGRTSPVPVRAAVMAMRDLGDGSPTESLFMHSPTRRCVKRPAEKKGHAFYYFHGRDAEAVRAADDDGFWRIAQQLETSVDKLDTMVGDRNADLDGPRVAYLKEVIASSCQQLFETPALARDTLS